MFKKENFKLIAVIAIMIIVIVGGYYFINLKQSKYPVSSFISLNFKWGTGDTLLNSYSSKTSDYQYLDNKDSLIHKRVKLRANNIIFVHSKANELNLWELPDIIVNKGADLKSKRVLRYEMIFNYKEKTKKIIYLTDYDENPVIAGQVDQLQMLIKGVLDEIEDRYQ